MFLQSAIRRFTRLILQLLVRELAEIIRIMAESAPVVRYTWITRLIARTGAQYTMAEEDLSLWLLREWVVISRFLRFV